MVRSCWWEGTQRAWGKQQGRSCQYEQHDNRTFDLSNKRCQWATSRDTECWRSRSCTCQGTELARENEEEVEIPNGIVSANRFRMVHRSLLLTITPWLSHRIEYAVLSMWPAPRCGCAAGQWLVVRRGSGNIWKANTRQNVRTGPWKCPAGCRPIRYDSCRLLDGLMQWYVACCFQKMAMGRSYSTNR